MEGPYPFLPGAAGGGREGVRDVAVTWLKAMSGAEGKSAGSKGVEGR